MLTIAGRQSIVFRASLTPDDPVSGHASPVHRVVKFSATIAEHRAARHPDPHEARGEGEHAPQNKTYVGVMRRPIATDRNHDARS